MCCEMCQRKRCNKGRPCKRLEKELPKPYTGKLPKGEFSFDPHYLDFMQDHSIWSPCGGGSRKKPVRYNENWEMDNED